MTKAQSSLLKSYPRLRPELPERLREVYEQTYLASRNGNGFLYALTQRLEGWMHRKASALSRPGECVLEIGAGTLNHLPWERKWRVYDVVEPFSALYLNQSRAKLVSTFYANIAEVPPDQTYDRIISIAALEHVLDLPSVVAKAALLLKPGATFSVAIPSEGGFLWAFAWKISVGLAFKIRTGLNYGDLMRHEHVSTAAEIESILRYFFHKVGIRRFPGPWRHCSLYEHYYCADPDLRRCIRYLQSDARQQTVAGGCLNHCAPAFP
jgi:SAM-dependent methyltransferase